MGIEDVREERFTVRLAPDLKSSIDVVEGALKRAFVGGVDRSTTVRVLLVAALGVASKDGELRAGAATINLDDEERTTLGAALSRLSADGRG